MDRDLRDGVPLRELSEGAVWRSSDSQRRSGRPRELLVRGAADRGGHSFPLQQSIEVGDLIEDVRASQ